MIIGRNEPTVGTGANWLGYQEVGLSTITDKSQQFDWCDVLWQVELVRDDLKYPIKLDIAGSYEYEGGKGGDLKKNRLIRDMYYFFDAIGFTGGINVRGEFENEDGELIPDIIAELQKYIPVVSFPNNPPTDFYVFVWSKFNKKRNKCYGSTCSKIVKNTAEGKAELTDYVKYSQGKGWMLDESAKEDAHATTTNISTEDEERI